jgi:hypothetical protein
MLDPHPLPQLFVQGLIRLDATKIQLSKLPRQGENDNH